MTGKPRNAGIRVDFFITRFPYKMFALFRSGHAIEIILQFTPDFDLKPLPLSGAYFPDFFNEF